MTQAFDIVIVGAGMVGAALATGLGREGFSVAMVDRAPAPTFDPEAAPDIRVSALSAGSERYLRSLGAWDHILGMRVTPYRRLAVWDETRHPLSDLLPRASNKVEFNAAGLNTSHLGHIVENSVTQQGLWHAAEAEPSVTILAGNGISSIAQTAELATVTLEDGQQLTTALVIGADGAQSRVRDMAGIGVTRNQYGQQAMVISVRYQGPIEDITWQGFYPSGPRAFLPLYSAGADYPGESRASLVWYDSPEEIARLKSLSNDALMAEIQLGFPAELPHLTHIEDRASFPIARQHAKQYFAGRIVLTGDAAHTINPLAGQGVNLGFQDAQCLQSVLKEARRAGEDLAKPSRLASYEQQRRPANRRMMFAMDAFYHLFSNRFPPFHLLRNLGLGTVRALPFARNRVARYAMGIDDELPAVIRQLASSLPGLNQP
ncbi:2-octaprenyl-3-methyl-6-methoxy-1,4-benzoquinol hydroxylase [Marinobacter antarcticus]|uniref:2-octaprenyl-3-methyl-6-methoxy-1,4-benzoquinol hydroxylase n=1 Tax=Marinobacter antarcticus TaxID=564117 RepID=A0A1M6QFA0_9GAMM|nr:FAD-dependent monooxygenase [Marinobacter antarcticus]SHK18723.1 2-octaprenyl-3-methyl-6-methoxy-1,4-benzoquinol hydroxylase [Marinobacter antarcticus]